MAPILPDYAKSACPLPQPDNRLCISVLSSGSVPDRPGKYHVPGRVETRPEAAAKAAELSDRVDLRERDDNFPHQFSGGEKQRVAICRALINSPQIVFADEPTGNLDSANGETILLLLLELRREHDTTLVMVTHSREIGRMADRTVRLVDGRITP